MLFPVLEVEAIVQEGDKTRLDASRSYAAGETINKIEIQPGEDEDFYDVTSTGYLDWQFTLTDAETDPTENFAVIARLNHIDENLPEQEEVDGVSLEKAISITSAAEDGLLSTDDQLRQHEPLIFNFLTPGRASFKDVHRRALVLMLDWLAKEGHVDVLGNRFTKEAFVNIEEAAQWSAMLVLRLIFEGVSNAIDDIHADKAKRYKGLEVMYRDRAVLRIDVDNDGTVTTGEQVDIRSCVVRRR